MNEGYIIGLGQKMMYDSLLISLPILGVGLLVGVFDQYCPGPPPK